MAINSKKKTSTTGSDFETLEAVDKKAIILLHGESKTGKTTFGTRFAPSPQAAISFDQRSKAAVKKAMNSGKVIHYLEINMPPHKMETAESIRVARELLEKTIDNLQWAVDRSMDGEIKTIIFDGGTEFNEICKIAFDGAIDRTKDGGAFGKDIDYVKKQWRRVFKLARSGKAHFIVTARSTEIWVDNKATGAYKPVGSTAMEELVDFVMVAKVRKVKGRVKSDFELHVTRCGVNETQLGEVYTSKDWDELGPFTYACFMQYGADGESDIEDWQ